MKTFLIYLVLALCYLCLYQAAPAGNQQQVQFLKYSNDKELEEIQRQIIAQYEHLGGSTQFHEEQSASFVDPQHIKINI